MGRTELEPNRRLVLEARGWPVGTARVDITDQPDGDGSLATIEEDITDGPARLIPQPIRLPAIEVRNRETLRGLARVATKRAAA